ncbi:MAG: hypothetical protein ACK4NF_06950, partial [Planctomycetota bacterium]
EKTKKISSEIDDVFKTFINEKINIFKTENNIKHHKFFENLKLRNGYTGEFQIISSKDIEAIKSITYEFFKWLEGLAKDSGKSPVFGKWYSQSETYYSSDEDVKDKELGTEDNIFSINPDFVPYFKTVYENLFVLIKKVKVGEGAGGEKKEEFVQKFAEAYNTLLPSLLMAKHLVDNIPEFRNVYLDSIYISSYNPIKLSMIKIYTPEDRKKGDIISNQPTLCFCFKPVQDKKDVKMVGKVATFNCYPADTTRNLSYNLTHRSWEIKKGADTENIDKNLLELSTTGIEYNLYPNELGTTIPILFVFKSNYDNFYNLLRAFYQINEKKIFDFGENSPKLPVPITVSKISWKLNENISSSNFEFKRVLDQYPIPGGDQGWKEFLDKEENQRLQKLEENLKNTYFTFLLEILVFLYDPEGFVECWNNIPSYPEAIEHTVK